jgi:uncharacterized membrane protein
MNITLAPLLNAPPAIQIHAFAAIGAIVLGIIQIAAPKGTLLHRTLGWCFVTLMMVLVGSSFFVHQLRTWGLWSPIHLISISTLVSVPMAVIYARRHNVAVHRTMMLSLYFGGLLFAMVLTLLPNRIFHIIIFGP